MTACRPMAKEKSPTLMLADSVIGSSSNPKMLRAPKLMNRMMVPQVSTTIGVRQEPCITGQFLRNSDVKTIPNPRRVPRAGHAGGA